MHIQNKKIIIIATITIITLIAIYSIFIKNKDYIETTEEIDTLETETNNTKEEKTSENKIIIYITGAIKKEGVYELKENSRISDAIEIAGGLTENANIENINLAYTLEDGVKIHIPTKEESKNSQETTYINKNTEGIETTNIEKSNSNLANTTKEKVNINTATQTQLETLPGIGPSTAQKIINYRKENGKYKTIEDIKKVSGIGESKYNKIKELIKV